MTSSCGEDAGTLAYHMTAALMTSQSPDTCPVRPVTDNDRGDTSVLLFVKEYAAYIFHALRLNLTLVIEFQACSNGGRGKLSPICSLFPSK